MLRQAGGTPAARSERDAFVEMYSQRITQLDAAENGLCFGRLDLTEGERRYIGRMGILDDADDYEALLVDWRAPAARPFYIATAFSPGDVRAAVISAPGSATRDRRGRRGTRLRPARPPTRPGTQG